MTQTLIDSIIEIINSNKRFLITSHVDPDGDSVGSQMALYHALTDAGKEVAVINQGVLPSKYKFLDPGSVISFDKDSLGFVPEVVFILECPSIDRIGAVRGIIPESAKVVNIDHHPDNNEYGDINLVDVDSSAVGETLYLIFNAGNFPVSDKMAVTLYAAIVSDTGRFRFGSTTSRSLKVAANLVEKGASPKFVSDSIFSDYAPETVRLLGNTLAGLQLDAGGKIGYVTISLGDLEKFGAVMENSEGFVDFILAISGIHLGFMFKQLSENRVKVSVRSQNGCDAAAFARSFNGGGHVNAAGFTTEGNLAQVVESVIAKAREFVIHGS